LFNRFQLLGSDNQHVDDGGGRDGENDGDSGLETLGEDRLFGVRLLSETEKHEPREAERTRRREIEHEYDGSVGEGRAVQ